MRKKKSVRFIKRESPWFIIFCHIEIYISIRQLACPTTTSSTRTNQQKRVRVLATWAFILFLIWRFPLALLLPPNARDDFASAAGFSAVHLTLCRRVAAVVIIIIIFWQREIFLSVDIFLSPDFSRFNWQSSHFLTKPRTQVTSRIEQTINTHKRISTGSSPPCVLQIHLCCQQ